MFATTTSSLEPRAPGAFGEAPLTPSASDRAAGDLVKPLKHFSLSSFLFAFKKEETMLTKFVF
jgi:hypothetical protein